MFSKHKSRPKAKKIFGILWETFFASGDMILFPQRYHGWANGETIEETSKFSNVSVAVFPRLLRALGTIWWCTRNRNWYYPVPNQPARTAQKPFSFSKLFILHILKFSSCMKKHQKVVARFKLARKFQNVFPRSLSPKNFSNVGDAGRPGWCSFEKGCWWLTFRWP